MATPRPVTPKRLVLDLLRVARDKPVPVGALVGVGALFGLTGNSMRVAITRLLARGLVESDERGSYRLSPATDPLTAHVERWREGEARMRRWESEWLLVSPPRGADRSTRRHSLRALGLSGFREGLDGLWTRPHNLAEPLSTTFERLGALGLDPGARHFVASHLDAKLRRRWETTLWPIEQLQRGYRRALDSVERSMARVGSMPAEQALVETFVVGGEAIRVIATDPLLPEAILSSFERRALSDAMLRYDELGRGIWGRLRREFEAGRSESSAEALP